MATSLCSLALCLMAAGGAQLDWKKLRPEILDHYAALLKIDTSNPPGNETKAALYLKGVLERAGIPARLFALEPARANLVARFKGSGAKRPVLVMGHTDVVGVQRNRWSVDPFAAIRKNGYIYGRGAQDDKDNTVAGLMLMLLLKRMNVPLARDVIFLAEAGEEGTTRVGIDFMVARHWSEIEAEYALAEGGTAVAQGGKVRYITIITTEKVPRGIRLVARGTAGHGSRPTLDNAVVRLAAAVAKVGSWRPPMRLNDTTRKYFERLATVSPPDQAERYRNILNPSRREEVESYFAEHELGHNSILRTSISPTMIRAGFRSNVIPSEAEGYLDVRALPDEDMEKFVAELRRVIGDPKVEVIPPPGGGRPASPPSRVDTEMFRALEKAQRQMYPQAITLPAMLTGATDMAQLRAKGVQAYGFGPVVEGEGALEGGPHSDDERLAEDSMVQLVEFLWRAVMEVAAQR